MRFLYYPGCSLKSSGRAYEESLLAVFAKLGFPVEELGQRRSYMILHEAIRRGVDAVATACPFCQFNLECFQSQISRRYHDDVALPVAYFTQIVGLAMGLNDRALGLHRLFIPLRRQAAAV